MCSFPASGSSWKNFAREGVAMDAPGSPATSGRAPRFVSRSLRSRSRRVGGCLPGRGHCSAGDPIAGLLSRGRERDLPGSQAVHPVPLPRSRTPAESTIPRLLSVSSMLPLLPSQQRLQRNGNFGATARLQHLLPTLPRVMLPPPLQSSLPAGWLAFSGRELNPLDRYKRFQIKFSFSSSGFILTQEGSSLPFYECTPSPCPLQAAGAVGRA